MYKPFPKPDSESARKRKVVGGKKRYYLSRSAGWVRTRWGFLYYRWSSFVYFSEREGFRKYIKLGKLILGVEPNRYR